MNDSRVPSEPELYDILDRVHELDTGTGVLHIRVAAYWQGSTRWTRNRIGMCVNRTDHYLMIDREIAGGWGKTVTNQFNDRSIVSALKYTEWMANERRRNWFPRDYSIPIPEHHDPDAIVWSDKTLAYNFIDAGKVVRSICDQSETERLMSAGYIECTAGSSAYSLYNHSSNNRIRRYVKLSKGQCSTTVRNPSEMASGWAGVSQIDFGKVDEEAIASKAFDKCIASANPVRLEPGRYTAILEPQAVADMISYSLFAHGVIVSREYAEGSPLRHNASPFFLNYDPVTRLSRSKLGLQMFDKRISVWHDPLDPEMGLVGFQPDAMGIAPIKYVENGVLTSLPYDAIYSANRLEITGHNVHRNSFRMSGGDSTLDEMIANTDRGLVITRFSGGSTMNSSSLVATGLTRDGLWLIENGKVRHAVRNFRTLESPFFILNQVEQLGLPEKVFSEHPGSLVSPSDMLAYQARNFAPQFIVPSMKVRDFSFSTTIDAV